MGMFDTVKFHPDDAPTCHAGHHMLSFQTKHLECKLTSYLVHDGVLHVLKAVQPLGVDGVAYEYDYTRLTKAEDGTLTLIRETQGTPVDWGSNLRSIRIYAACFHCKPILAVGQYGYDSIDEKRIWVEFDLVLRGNRVEGCQLSNGDRDTQLAQLQKQGALVFEDEHPIAVAHYYRLEQEQKSNPERW